MSVKQEVNAASWVYIGPPSTAGFGMGPHQTEESRKQGITTEAKKLTIQIDYNMPWVPRLSGKAFRKASIPTECIQAELEKDLFKLLC